jgi:hypothetical protein
MKACMASAGLLAGFALLPAGVDAQKTEKAMTVFVTATEVVDVTKVDKETQKSLEAAIKDAEKKRKDLEKTLKAQHGNKRENWPQEAQDAYYDVEEAEALANADWGYRRVKQAGLSDSVDDIKKSLVGEGLAGKKDNVTLVQTKDEAQLIIEVNGRRSASSGAQGAALAFRDDQYWISFLVKPGAKLSADRFASVPRAYRFKRFGYGAWRLASPRPESPEWRFEAFGNQRWGNAANTATLLIEDFIAKNYDAMMATGTSR